MSTAAERIRISLTQVDEDNWSGDVFLDGETHICQANIKKKFAKETNKPYFMLEVTDISGEYDYKRAGFVNFFTKKEGIGGALCNPVEIELIHNDRTHTLSFPAAGDIYEGDGKQKIDLSYAEGMYIKNEQLGPDHKWFKKYCLNLPSPDEVEEKPETVDTPPF